MGEIKLMSPTKHVIMSGAVSLGFFAITKSWGGSMACFLSGIFIDIDHVFDFWVVKRRLLFSYKELFAFGGREKNVPLCLIFHSYELLAIFAIVIFIFHLNVVWLGFFWGALTHLGADQFTNPIKPPAYFLYYRFKYRFDKEYLFKKEYYQYMV